MPTIFRAMTKDGELPLVAQSARGLGVREPEDVTLKGFEVDRTCGGMSVAPSWRDLPSHRIPRRLRSKVGRKEKDAAGSNADFCWAMGHGPFVEEAVTAELWLIPDAHNPPNEIHGSVVATERMALTAFRDALAGTRGAWRIDED